MVFTFFSYGGLNRIYLLVDHDRSIPPLLCIQIIAFRGYHVLGIWVGHINKAVKHTQLFLNIYFRYKDDGYIMNALMALLFFLIL